MKKLLLLFVLVTALFNCNILNAKEFEVPENYELKTDEDYADYEDEIIEACDWLIHHDYQSEEAKQKEVSNFFMFWIIGSPNVTVLMNENFVFSNKKLKVALVFMAGWTKYALESRDFDNQEAASLAGLEAVLDHYNVVKEYFGKDDNIEEYIKLKADGKLKAFVKEAVEKKEEKNSNE